MSKSLFYVIVTSYNFDVLVNIVYIHSHRHECTCFFLSKVSATCVTQQDLPPRPLMRTSMFNVKVQRFFCAFREKCLRKLAYKLCLYV